MKIFILYLLLFIIIFYFNFILYKQEIVTILLSSLFIFLLCIFYLFYINIEFLAVALATVYVSGLLIVFLFFILTTNLSYDLKQMNLIFANYNFVSFLTIVMSYLVSIILAHFHDPLITINWALFGLDYKTIEWLEYRDLIGERPGLMKDVSDDELIWDSILNIDNLSEIYALGVYVYHYYPLLIPLIGIFLFLATIVPLYICTLTIKD